jgi:hypothetical protein
VRKRIAPGPIEVELKCLNACVTGLCAACLRAGTVEIFVRWQRPRPTRVDCTVILRHA